MYSILPSRQAARVPLEPPLLIFSSCQFASELDGQPVRSCTRENSLTDFCLRRVAYQTVSLMMSTVIVFASASWPHPINPLLLGEGDLAGVTTAKCGGHGSCVSRDYTVRGQRSDSAYCHGPSSVNPLHTIHYPIEAITQHLPASSISGVSGPPVAEEPSDHEDLARRNRRKRYGGEDTEITWSSSRTMSSKSPSTPAASYRMISVPEAQDLILQHTFRLQQQQVPLAEAVGCVLASDVQAMDNIPPYRASIKVSGTAPSRPPLVSVPSAR